jgi:hypothetical protein
MLQHKPTVVGDFSLENRSFVGTNGVIYCFLVGDQNSLTLHKVAQVIDEIITRFRHSGKKVLILVNLNQLGKAPISARRRAADMIRNCDFDNLALVGNNILLKTMVDFVIKASGQNYKIRSFTNDDRAKEWLLR